MIENMNMNGLTGQMELGDVMQGMAEAGPRGDEGYDAEGRLINPESVLTPEATDRLGVIAAEIHAITEQTRGVVISAALQIGRRLIEAKGLVPQGRWTEWLEANVDYSERRAQDLMRLYEEYGRADAIPDAIARLDYSKAVALLGAPEAARAELAEKADAEGLSVRQLREEIRKLRAEKDEQQQRLDDLFEAKRRDGEQLEALGSRYDEAMERIRDDAITAENAIQREREAVRLAEAKASAAESSAEALRKLHADAEDRAAASAQRASDAVNRANETAKKLSEARAMIKALEDQAKVLEELAEAKPEVKTVEVVPEDVQRELEALRAKNAELAAAIQDRPEPAEAAAPMSATEKFKFFYANQMKPAFSTALELLREVAREDGHAADMFATALTKGCQQLMNQLGEGTR